MLFSVFGKEVFSKIRADLKSSCNSEVHSIHCRCYARAEKAFRKLAKRGDFWKQYKSR